jgi:hypothetical protein
MNLQLQVKSASQPLEEKLVILHGITWKRFKAIKANLEGIQEVRLSYAHP